MSGRETEDKRRQLEQAIAVQESLRGTVDDEIIDTTIASLKDKLAALESTSQQQRKLATILFMDIAGHTALTVDLDPEEQMAVVDPAITRLAVMVDEHGGHVARYQGDGFKAVFGLPTAHEDDPRQAVRAGLAIQAEAAAIAEELEAARGLAGFSVRVGITTGMVFAGGESEGEDTIKGPPVNLAARLESAAEPGTVLISRDTFNHVRGVFDMRALEPIQAKGFAEPVPVYRVLGTKPRAFYQEARGVEGVETEMVGRHTEFSLLQDAWGLARSDGVVQQVTIVGEAGLGKSRLLQEFETWADLQPERVVLFRARAEQGGQGLPYGLLRSLLAFRFEIQDDDPRDVVGEKFRKGLSEDIPNTGELAMRADFLGTLAGYSLADSPHLEVVQDDAQQLRDRAVKYLVEYLDSESQRGLVMVLMEDLHWADDSSLDVLTEIAQRLKRRPLLLVGAARPTLFRRRPHWCEGQLYHTRVNLSPLSKLASRRLVAAILKMVADLPLDLRDMLIEHAEGNPYYLEELVKMLVEQGAIEKGEERWRVVPSKLEKVQVPQTLTGVLQGRLERLGKDERDILQQAAVIGRIFWDLLLVYLQETEDTERGREQVLDLLESLRGRELVYRREGSSFGEAVEHIFKHDLLRDVAYESVLLRLRRRYHSRAADWLIENGKKHGVRQPGLVAGHLLKAGREAEAVDYLQEAGEMAAAAFAHEEAADFFGQALGLISDDELERRYFLHLAREKEFDHLGKRELQTVDLDSLERIAAELAEPGKQARAARRRSEFAFSVGDFPEAEAAAEKALTLAEEAQDPGLLGKASFSLGRMHWMTDNYPACLRLMERALTLARAAGDRYLEAMALPYMFLKDRGDLAQNQVYHEQALAICREIGHLVGEGELLNETACDLMVQGKVEQAKVYFERQLDISRRIGNRQFESMALVNLGGMIAEAQGNFNQARRFLEEGIEIFHQTDNQNQLSNALTALGHALLGLGELDQAESVFRKTIRMKEDLGKPLGIFESRTGLALALLVKGETDQALVEINPVLEYIDSGGRLIDVQLEFHFREYLTCVMVLQANEDPRAEKLLAEAYRLMNEYADRIPDPSDRKFYLEELRWHRDLAALWDAHHEN